MKNVARFFFKKGPVLLLIATLGFLLPTLTGCRSANNPAGAADTAIVAPGATPQLVAKQFSFTEGPAVDGQGNVYFTDQPNDKIWKWDVQGNLTVFMDSTGRSNGMYFDKKGNLLTCADAQNQIWSISPDTKVTVLLNDVEGKKLNGPNDLWVAPNGDIYFTDPYYQRPYWTRKSGEIDGQHVYLLRNGTKNVVRVINNLEQPNGIIGTPDGKTLYVADIKGGKTYRYAIQKDGSLTDAQLFTTMGSDGMTIDNRGNIYLTGNGVTVFNKGGNKLTNIPLPGWTANVVFGGSNRDQLFITSGQAVYTLKMNVKGVK